MPCSYDISYTNWNLMNSLFYFSDIQTVNSISVVYYVFYIAISPNGDGIFLGILTARTEKET